MFARTYQFETMWEDDLRNCFSPFELMITVSSGPLYMSQLFLDNTSKAQKLWGELWSSSLHHISSPVPYTNTTSHVHSTNMYTSRLHTNVSTNFVFVRLEWFQSPKNVSHTSASLCSSTWSGFNLILLWTVWLYGATISSNTFTYRWA